MASLKPNLVKRIERLPKPTTVSGALIPLFEAVSNAIHSTQARYGDDVAVLGQVRVSISTDRKKSNVSATVEDNGDGLSPQNWEAFTTTDTDNKIKIGGKGVGRLLWLDCFKETKVSSVFLDDGVMHRRSFRFVLDNEDQIQEELIEEYPSGGSTSFFVSFQGLRDNAYSVKFPGRGNFIFQHLTLTPAREMKLSLSVLEFRAKAFSRQLEHAACQGNFCKPSRLLLRSRSDWVESGPR